MFIIPKQPSIGEVLGEGLADLAKTWGERYTATKALKSLGFNDSQARAYANLGPQFQQQAIQSLMNQQQQEQANAAISQILGTGLGGAQPQQHYQLAPMQQQAQQQQPQGFPRVQLPHEAQQEAIQQATSIAQNPNFRKLNEQQQQAQALQQKQLTQGAAPVKQATPEQQAILQSQAIQAQKGEPSLKQQIEQVRNQKKALTAANLPPNQTIALHQQLDAKERELRKEDREERKLTAADQREINRDTKETYHDVNKAAKAAKDSNIRLGRMEQLIRKGNLTNTAFYNGIKALGSIPGIGGYIESIAGSFLSPDSQEFEKLSTDFIKDAKQFFGNRITQQEVQLFLKTVPTLSQTDAGKQRVIRNMRIFNEAADLRKKTMDEIIRANGGRRPADLELLIEERVEPKLDELALQFKGG